jgi:hypothetical protein
VNQDLEATENELANLRGANVLAGRTGSVEEVRGWWTAAGVEDRRAVIDALMTIHIDPTGKSAPRKFDPERVRIDWKAAA